MIFKAYFYCKGQQEGNTQSSLDFPKEHNMSFNQNTYCVYYIWLETLPEHWGKRSEQREVGIKGAPLEKFIW